MSENFGKAYIILPENFGKAMISVYHSIGFSALSAHRSFFCTTKKPRNQKTKEIKNSRKHKRKNKNKNKTQQLPPYVNVTSSEVYSLFFFLTHVFFSLICANCQILLPPTPANSQSYMESRQTCPPSVPWLRLSTKKTHTAHSNEFERPFFLPKNPKYPTACMPPAFLLWSMRALCGMTYQALCHQECRTMV